MDFIQQGNTGKLGKWKYLLPVLGFFGIIALNFVAILLLDLDVDEMMRKSIERNGANWFLFESLIPMAIFLAGLFIWVKYVHKQSITSLTTSRKKIDWKRIFFAFTLWGIITAAMTIAAYYLTPEDFVWNLDWNKFLILAAIAIVLVPIQTSFEEYFFRGYLMQGLATVVKNRWFPLLFTSIVFGLMHGANPEVDKLGPIIMVYYIGTGLFLGVITLMDEGLELALGFHAANNLITALLVTSDWTAFQTDSIFRDVSEPSAGFDILIPVLVIFPILLFVFAKKYNWTNWKEKLTGKIVAISTSDDNYKVID
ncbi:MAG: CPBP family intramembrane metalloprotease domain-containing protein [Lutibacter sp.]|nr:MAG: CPBP family intramembrane metalloprotease domain-containing protein [Lutibacter sp.]